MSEEISTQELDSLIKTMRDKREEYDAVRKQASELYHEFKDMESKVLLALKNADKSKYHVDGVGTVSVVTRETVKVPKDLDDKRELFDWIKQKYGQDALDSYLTIHSQSLNSFYKKELENAEQPELFKIPGLSDPTVVEETRFRKE